MLSRSEKVFGPGRPITFSQKVRTTTEIVRFYTKPDDSGRRRMDVMNPVRMKYLLNHCINADDMLPAAIKTARAAIEELEMRKEINDVVMISNVPKQTTNEN